MTTTSKEYAEALFELAAADGVLEETAEGLETVESALMQTPEYRALLASPAIGREERLAALESAFGQSLPKVLMGVLRMMVSRGHISAREEMIREYMRLAMDFRGESIAVVTSAVPLKETEEVKLRALLEKKLNRKVTLRCLTDPALLGGVRVEVDGRVIDGSLRNKLDEIKDVMNA